MNTRKVEVRDFQVIIALTPILRTMTQALVAQMEHCKTQGMDDEARIFAKYAKRLRGVLVEETHEGVNSFPHVNTFP